MSQIDGLQFEEDGHRYTYKGKPILSVTQVLTLAGYRQPAPDPPSPSFILARNIGTAIHEATRLLDEDKLDPSTVDPRIAGYVEAWKKFKEDFHATIEEIEQPVLIRYGNLFAAGRFDRRGQFNSPQRRFIIDIKTGSQVAPDTALQTAAYSMGLEDYARRCTVRLSVHLRPDGKYKIYEYSDYVDFDLFRSALVTSNGKLRLGISKIEETF